MINIHDYTYSLPETQIAKFPIPDRDQSKLLIYKNNEIDHSIFKNITNYLPANSLLVFNDTKVIPARLLFQKETGASIELFLLEPQQPSDMSVALQSMKECVWHCTIGNIKRWKDNFILEKRVGEFVLEARLINRVLGLVQFSWSGQLTFGQVIGLIGETPLPPYLKRSPESNDKERYQTVYSRHEGAVAAPTAGLHFTPDILMLMDRRGIDRAQVTLHVSAGTFQPIKVENALEHTMHSEQIIVRKDVIRKLIREPKVCIAVGTTSMRTIESLYWMGAKVLLKRKDPFVVHQHDPYQLKLNLSIKEVLQAILDYLGDKEELVGYTSIYIYPGYSFKLCDAIITNFHQPNSTLLLLVAAFVGDNWKKIYEIALLHNYRFLSYGDSSLLWRKSCEI